MFKETFSLFLTQQIEEFITRKVMNVNANYLMKVLQNYIWRSEMFSFNS